jgi:hypothetical protein
MDLREKQEKQVYAILKDRVFSNAKEFDLNLLKKIGMDS